MAFKPGLTATYMQKFTAANLKEVLWTTLQNLQDGDVSRQDAGAIATQSRELIRVIKTQQSILAQAKKDVTKDLIDYATT